MSAVLLALVVRLLPPSRRDWGRAMLAESAAVPPGRDRWGHAVGCAAVVLTQPAVLRTLAYPLAAVAVLAGVLRWSAGIDHPPLRWGVVGLIALLLTVACLSGVLPGVLGPVAAGRTARVVRAGGCLLVAAMTAMFAAAVGTHGSPDEKASTAVPIFAVLLTSYLIGFLALTAGRTAVTGRALATGVAASVAAAAVWLSLQVAFPPLPTNVGGAVFTIGCGVAATVLARGGLLAALSVGVLAPLLVFLGVVLVSSYGPRWLIPDLVPANADPAESRIEIQDPYVAMLFLACLSALTLTAAAVATRRRPAATMTVC